MSFPALSGFSSGGGALSSTPYKTTYTWAGAGANAAVQQTVTATNKAGVSASAAFDVVPDVSAPTGGALNSTASPPAPEALSATASPAATRSRSAPTTASRGPASQSGLRASTLTLEAATLAAGCVRHVRRPHHDHRQSRAERAQRLLPLHAHGRGQRRQPREYLHDREGRHDDPADALAELQQPLTNAYYKAPTTRSTSGRPPGGLHGERQLERHGQRARAATPSARSPPTASAKPRQAVRWCTPSAPSATQPSASPTVFAATNAGASSASATYALLADTAGPTGGALTVNNVVAARRRLAPATTPPAASRSARAPNTTPTPARACSPRCSRARRAR